FSWPFGLAVGLGILAFTLRTLPAKVAVPLLIVLSAVSLADVVPLLRIIRANMAHASPRVLDRTVYEPALRAHARVEQWPSYQCAGAALAFADQESRELQFMTA